VDNQPGDLVRLRGTEKQDVASHKGRTGPGADGLLAAAAQAFYEVGYGGTAVRTIAAQANVTVPRQAARAVLAMCTAVSSWFHPGGPLTAEDVQREYVTLALNTVRYSPDKAGKARYAGDQPPRRSASKAELASRPTGDHCPGRVTGGPSGSGPRGTRAGARASRGATPGCGSHPPRRRNPGVSPRAEDSSLTAHSDDLDRAVRRNRVQGAFEARDHVAVERV
jgi:hypothetical protein